MRDGDARNEWSFGEVGLKRYADTNGEARIIHWCDADRVQELAILLGSFDVEEDVGFTFVFKHSGGFAVHRDVCAEGVGVSGKYVWRSSVVEVRPAAEIV